MNTMNRILVLLVILLFAAGCSMQAKLNRDFKGEHLEEATKAFSDIPAAKIPMNNGHTKHIYTKEERLTGTTINQGTKTLDPIHSPSVTKVEQFIFIVDENGLIISTQYESSYKRL
ncbi:hypothetical protein [Sunxiuqinia sp. sy24]|uniref:hypothetical protein n=1 Tax=Sunxiuqinia sp. sy24 TaxID=3461495 RepID=UPI00404565DB